MELVLIRHTACAIAAGVCYGQSDVPLSASADADIALTMTRVPPVRAVFSSPAVRCVTLAERLAQRDRCELMLLDELHELSFGVWEGQPWDLVPRVDSDHWAADPWRRAPPGGESEAELFSRVQAAYRTIVNYGAPRAAIVAHAGPLRLMRCLVLGRPLDERWNWSIAQGHVERLPHPA